MGITVLFLDEKFRDSWVYSARRANHYMPSLKVGSIVKVDRFEVARCSSMYKITDHPFLIRFISPTIIDEVITDVVGEIRSVQGSDLTKETTRVLIFFLKHLDSAIGVKVSALELDPIKVAEHGDSSFEVSALSVISSHHQNVSQLPQLFFLARWTLDQFNHPWDLQLNTSGSTLVAIRKKYNQERYIHFVVHISGACGQSLLQTSFVVSSVVEYFQEVVLPGNAISQKVWMCCQMMSRNIFCVPDIVPEDPVADERYDEATEQRTDAERRSFVFPILFRRILLRMRDMMKQLSNVPMQNVART
ncbi:hypothetical protein F2Q70_00003201 [Brassica cretica]|uniref:DUF223 domain-containing protein n=1 Tax=Brassica cretica TaxID=69181 RepID=A0A8S9IU83_BRACR|nr:hypothetical protein F2Q70_00003201 [Brassica cretica]